MKVAWCLRGQPRDVLAGYSTIKSFIDKHPSIHFDFFCHTWHSSDKSYIYPVSSYRSIVPIPQGLDIIKSIDTLYTPVEHYVQEPIDFDVSDIIPSLAVHNMSNINIINIKNTISNLYSQNKIRDILYEYVNRSGVLYDFVISSRYDLLKPITIDLRTLEFGKIYCANMHSPRRVLIENIYILTMSIFFEVCSIYKNLKSIINSREIEQKLQACGEYLHFVPETLMTASLHYFNYIDLLVLSPNIPDFH
jgi:hypothetical protein